MIDPQDIIVEVLGAPARMLAAPSETGFICPYVNRKCTKRSSADKAEPYPVCSLYKTARRGEIAPTAPICICPKRFNEVDFLNDVVAHCWPGTPTGPLSIAKEVKMDELGNIDFVIAEEAGDKIRQFISVELQAIDITGSVRPAYEALRAGEMLEKKPTYNFNWDNVYKRYITQLIRKGFSHHHWGTKIVAVIQDEVYRYFRDKYKFIRNKDVRDSTVNIIFMSYKFEGAAGINEYRLCLDAVEGTNHSSLQSAVNYTSAPSKEEFHARIKGALKRSAARD